MSLKTGYIGIKCVFDDFLGVLAQCYVDISKIKQEYSSHNQLYKMLLSSTSSCAADIKLEKATLPASREQEMSAHMVLQTGMSLRTIYGIE